MKTRLVLFIISIVLLVAIKQYIISHSFSHQAKDGTIINYAGRQRMLSQNIAKYAFSITYREAMEKTTDKQRRELRKLQKNWQKYHEGLKVRDKKLGLGGENSETIQKLFEELDRPYDIINNSLDGLLKVTNLSSLSPYTNAILNNEGTFLNKMDEIVFQYNAEYDDKIERTSQLLSILTVITIVIFLVGFYYLVYPFLKEKRN